MADTFARVPRWSRGYHVAQVEAFLGRARAAYEQAGSAGSASATLTARQVRTAGFDLVHGGYEVDAVDAALDRLEDALAAREQQRRGSPDPDQVAGTEVADAEVADAAARLHQRLDRPDGARFARGARFEVTYDPDDVDEMCRRLGPSLGGALNAARGRGGRTPWGVDADEVRRAVFRRRRGSRGYRESEVDAFLDRVVDLLLASSAR